MLNCKFNIDIPGFNQTFNSQEELDDFIISNYERIQASLSGANVRFSKDISPKEEVLAIIKKAKEDTKTSIEYDTTGSKIERNVKPGFIGVSKRLDDLKNGTKLLFQPFNIDHWKERMLKQSFDSHKASHPNMSDKDIEDLILKELDDKVKSWSIITKGGIQIHDLANLYFENPNLTVQELKNRYTEKDKKISEESIESLYKIFSTIQKELYQRTKDEDLEYFTEVALYDEESNTVGIIDLIAVDSKGNLYLFDYKTSTKKIDEWDRDKYLKSVYQLASYKQLAMNLRMNVKDLFLVPINIQEADDNQILKIEPDYNIFKSISTDLSSNRKIKDTVAHMIKSKYDVKTKMSGNVNNVHNKMFGLHTEDYEFRYKLFMRSDKIVNGKKGNYFLDEYNEPIYLSNNEEENKKIVLEYLLSKENSQNDFINSLKDELMRVKQDFNKNELISPFAKVRNSDKLHNFERLFNNYISSDWIILDLPELEMHGIIGFKNTFSDSIDFVMLQSENFSDIVPLTYGKNLLGNFLSDSNPKVLESEDKVLATRKNVEATKILIHLNDNMDLFEKSTLNMIRAYNYLTGDVEAVNVNLLKNEVEYFYKNLNLPFNLNRIKTTSSAKILLAEINNVLNLSETFRKQKERIVLAKLFKTVGNLPTDKSIAVQELIKLQKEFMQIEGFNKPESVDVNSDMYKVWGYLNHLIVELTDRKIKFEEVDMKTWGLTESTMLSSFNEIQKRTVRVALEPLRMAMDAMSQQFIEYESKTLRKPFEKFYKDKGVIGVIGNYQFKFENLFVKNAEGKIAKSFQFKNPDLHENDPTYLDPSEREFLRTILPIINDWVDNNKNIAERKLDGSYYNVPITRASGTSRFLETRGIGVINSLVGSIKEGLDIQNIFTEQEVENIQASNSMTEMYDQFAINDNENSRRKYLEDHDLIEFEKNIEIVLYKMIFSKIRKRAYDRALPITNAVLAASAAEQQGISDLPLPKMYEYIRNYVKTVVYDDKLSESHLNPTFRTLGSLKHGVSLMRLGLQPLNLMRETLVGQWNNLSKIAIKMYGEDSPTLHHYTTAIKIMTEETPQFIHTVTLVEKLNELYRMANMDTGQLAEKMIISKKGITQFGSRWFLWFMGAPDYMNRMSFMVAKMLKDGSWAAHKMVDGQLIYDWTKDERFSAYANKDKSDINLYNEQRALYLKLLKEFNTEAVSTGIRVKDLVEGDALPRAYTNQERDSIKAFINYTHGPYDKEERIALQSTLFGMLFMHFKTWMKSKTQQWYMNGDKYAFGRYTHKENKNGDLLYVDNEGNITTEITDNPFIEWEGNYMEGIYQSVLRTLKEIHTLNYNPSEIAKFLSNDPIVKKNLAMAMSDLALWALLVLLVGGLKDELIEDSPTLKSLVTSISMAGSDLMIVNTLLAFLNPTNMFPSIGYSVDMVTNVFNTVIGEKDWKRTVAESMAMTRTIDNLTDWLKE